MKGLSGKPEDLVLIPDTHVKPLYFLRVHAIGVLWERRDGEMGRAAELTGQLI